MSTQNVVTRSKWVKDIDGDSISPDEVFESLQVENSIEIQNAADAEYSITEYETSRGNSKIASLINGIPMNPTAEKDFIVGVAGLNIKAKESFAKNAPDQWVQGVNQISRNRVLDGEEVQALSSHDLIIRQTDEGQRYVAAVRHQSERGISDAEFFRTAFETISTQFGGEDRVGIDFYSHDLDYFTASFFMPQDLTGEVTPGDVVHGGIVLQNSYLNGDIVPTVGLYTYRVVCANGLMALNNNTNFELDGFGEDGYDWRESLRTGIHNAVNQYQSEMEMYRHLSQTPVTDSGDTLRAIRDGYGLGRQITEEDITHAVQNGEVQNLWQLINVITEAANDVASPQRRRRMQMVAGEVSRQHSLVCDHCHQVVKSRKTI